MNYIKVNSYSIIWIVFFIFYIKTSWEPCCIRQGLSLQGKLIPVIAKDLPENTSLIGKQTNPELTAPMTSFVKLSHTNSTSFLPYFTLGQVPENWEPSLQSRVYWNSSNYSVLSFFSLLFQPFSFFSAKTTMKALPSLPASWLPGVSPGGPSRCGVPPPSGEYR